MAHQDKRKWIFVSQHVMYVCLDCGGVGDLHCPNHSLGSAIVSEVVIFPSIKCAVDRLREPRYEPVEGITHKSE